MHGSVQTWTPKRAQETLAKATHPDNRRISRIKVRSYANQMKSGAWRTTAEGIVFTDDGLLINGHHRLLAIVEADIPVDLYTVVGEDPDNFAAYDQAIRRNAAQFYRGADANSKMAAIAKIKALTGTAAPGSSRGSNNKATLAEQLAASDEWAWAVEAVWQDCRAVNNSTQISLSSLAAVVALAYSRGHREKITEFLSGLATGAELPAGDPRLALRNRWAVDGKNLNASGEVASQGLIANAWTAFVEGRSVATVKFTSRSPYPPKIG